MNKFGLFLTSPIGVFAGVIIGAIALLFLPKALEFFPKALIFFPELFDPNIYNNFEKTYTAWQGTVGVAASVAGAMVTVYVANMALKLASATANMSFKDTTRESDELARKICTELKRIDADLRLSFDEVLRAAERLLEHKAVWFFGAARLIAREPIYEMQLFTNERWEEFGLRRDIHASEYQCIRSLLQEASKKDIDRQNAQYAQIVEDGGQEQADYIYGESFVPSSEFDNLVQQLDRLFTTGNRIPYSKLRTMHIDRTFEMDLKELRNGLAKMSESLRKINNSEYLSVACDMHADVKQAINFISTRLDSFAAWNQDHDLSLDHLFHAKVLSDFVHLELNILDNEGATEYQTESRVLMFIAGLLTACERTNVSKLFSKYGTFSEMKSLKKLLVFMIGADGKSMIDTFSLRCDDPSPAKERKVWEPVVLKSYSAHPKFGQILQSVSNGMDSYSEFRTSFKQQVRDSSHPDYYEEYPHELIFKNHLSQARRYLLAD